MNSQEALLRRRQETARVGAEEIARALTKTLVLLPYKGDCTCGMMLTERDRTGTKQSYLCPRCGRSGLPAGPKSAPADARRKEPQASLYGP